MKAKKALCERLVDVGEALQEAIDEAVNDMLHPYLERIDKSDKRLAEVEHQVAAAWRTSTAKHVRNRKR